VPHFVCNEDGHHRPEINCAIPHHGRQQHGQLPAFRRLHQSIHRLENPKAWRKSGGENAHAGRKEKRDGHLPISDK